MRVINFSYVLDPPLEVIEHAGERICPLCSNGADLNSLGAMKLYQGQGGYRAWMCKNLKCRFAYPVWWCIEESLLLKLVRERREFLQAVRQEVEFERSEPCL